MTNYSGALLAKRKDELAHIAKDLDLNLPDYTLRPDIIEGIRTKLRSDPAARHDPRFRGLWLSMRESRKSSEDTVDLNEHAIDDEDDDEEEDDQDREDDSRDEVDQGIADAEEAITSYRDVLLHNKIVDSLLHGEAPLLPDSPARHGVSSGAEAVEKALVPASHALRTVTRRSGSFSQLARRGSTSLRHAARETVTLVEDVQDRASQSWVVVACILAAETAWLVYEAVPWVENHFGPHDWLHRQTPTASFSLLLPALSVLLHATFFRAVLAWALTTYLVPLAAATLVSFPTHHHSEAGSPSTPRTRRRSSPSKRSSASVSRASAAGHLSPPNAVIFALVRLAIALLRGHILTPTSAPAPEDLAHAASHAASAALRNLSQVLLDARIGADAGAGELVAWTFEGAVSGVWGVVAVGMGLAAAVGIYAEVRR
ncbi:hypothetical protein JCM8202_001726 [Rhodotorula sphaerocarpa]